MLLVVVRTSVLEGSLPNPSARSPTKLLVYGVICHFTDLSDIAWVKASTGGGQG